MTKQDFLTQIENAYGEWSALLARVPHTRMTEKVDGQWTLKDTVAHVTWGEREMVGVLRQRALLGSDLWNVSQAERNETVFQENRTRALDDVLGEAEAVHTALMRELEKTPDDELNDAKFFHAMPADWQPWQVIASNTYEHYPEHVAVIRAWLEKI